MGGAYIIASGLPEPPSYDLSYRPTLLFCATSSRVLDDKIQKPKMKKTILISFASIILFSCATQVSSVNPMQRTYNSKPIGKLLSVDIGEPLTVKGSEYYQKAYLIKNTPEFNIGMVAYPYKNGDVLPLSGTVKGYNLYYLKGASVNPGYQIGVAENTTTGEANPFINSVNGFNTKKIEGFSVSASEYREKDCQECFKKEMVYNGKSGNTLKFIYREYVNDMARPAFNQDLQYDLSESTMIGFKGLRINVVSATNTTIEYKVEQDFQ